MEYFLYFLPFIFAAVYLFIFREKLNIWFYVSLIGTSIFFTFVIKNIMVSCNETDTEYYGGYISKITHYDEWDEWVHRTCTKRVYDGTDSEGHTKYRTEHYDCSYREVHPERWKYTDDNGIEHYFFSKAKFDQVKKEFGNPKMVFREMHRNYYKKDGDAQDYFYDGKVEHIRALTSKHDYKNKLISSKSIFNLEDIDKDEAKKIGLFDYPEIINDDQDVIIGKCLPLKTHKKFKYVNSIYGSSRQFRIYLLIFDGKPYNISEQQRAYWQGGNKNEFVVCLGYDKNDNKITWCNAFSWSDKPTLELATERFFRENNRFSDIDKYGDWLRRNLNLWERKKFHDFDYIETELSVWQNVTLTILTIIFDIVISVFSINYFRTEKW